MIPCRICGTLILGSKNALTCSRACANKSRTGMFYGGIRPSKSRVTTLRIIRDRLISLRGPKCEICGYDRYKEILQVHHVIPKKLGGTDDDSNLQIICPNCHAIEHYVKLVK